MQSVGHTSVEVRLTRVLNRDLRAPSMQLRQRARIHWSVAAEPQKVYLSCIGQQPEALFLDGDDPT